MTNLKSPLQFDDTGRTALAGDDAHIRDMIELVLFTTPGERVNRPDFGSGLLQMVFAPASGDLASAAQLLVQGALQRWVGDLIQLEGVSVDGDDSTVRVTVRYVVRRTQRREVITFSRGGAA
jgi:uncharacterized protein